MTLKLQIVTRQKNKSSNNGLERHNGEENGFSRNISDSKPGRARIQQVFATNFMNEHDSWLIVLRTGQDIDSYGINMAHYLF